jgi:hypothetical protein
MAVRHRQIIVSDSGHRRRQFVVSDSGLRHRQIIVSDSGHRRRQFVVSDSRLFSCRADFSHNFVRSSSCFALSSSPQVGIASRDCFVCCRRRFSLNFSLTNGHAVCRGKFRFFLGRKLLNSPYSSFKLVGSPTVAIGAQGEPPDCGNSTEICLLKLLRCVVSFGRCPKGRFTPLAPKGHRCRWSGEPFGHRFE